MHFLFETYLSIIIPWKYELKFCSTFSTLNNFVRTFKLEFNFKRLWEIIRDYCLSLSLNLFCVYIYHCWCDAIIARIILIDIRCRQGKVLSCVWHEYHFSFILVLCHGIYKNRLPWWISYILILRSKR